MTSVKVAANRVVLFGYDSSAFTQKVRHTLRLKQIPYTFVVVPSMMPRPILKDNFNITYRKIPVLALEKDMYIDTSLIMEALEHQFPQSQGYGTIYPNRSLRPIIRGFGSYWTDRPFFRVTTGLVPPSVWRTHFGTDRANLIGHELDPEKLGRKVPQNLSGLDLHLSLLEPLLDNGNQWLFGTEQPSAADIALFYQLDWGEKIARGEGASDLTGGGLSDGDGEGVQSVFNFERYPNLSAWFQRFKDYFNSLPLTEQRIERNDAEGIQKVISILKGRSLADETPLLPTPAGPHQNLDARNGLVLGTVVSIVPDDTGRGNPTIGTLEAASPEEVVIAPQDVDGKLPLVGKVRVHFPRVGFVIKPLDQSRL